MARYFGSPRCVECGGEDCVCCEVYLESRADENYEPDPLDGGYDPWDNMDDSYGEDDYDPEEEYLERDTGDWGMESYYEE